MKHSLLNISDGCDKRNILIYEYVKTFTANNTKKFGFAYAYKGMKGEDFKVANEHPVRAVFKKPVCVSEVAVERFVTGLPTSNVVQIEVSYLNAEDKDVTTADGRKVVLQSTDKNATVFEEKMRCDVQTVNIKLLKTDDGQPPSAVRIVINGCYDISR